MASTELALLIASGLIALSIFFTKISSRLGIPSLIAFLLIGVLAGPEGVGHLTLDNPEALKLVGILALVMILFSGGFESSWREVKSIITRGLIMATFGLIVSACLMSLGLHYLFGLSWLNGLLLGSIVSCTDPAAVF